MNAKPTTINVFFSYAHEDEELRDKLATHLKILQRQDIIQTWYDRDLQVGHEWDTEIKKQLGEADVILLLVSPDFLASDYCWDVEVATAMDRHRDPSDFAIVVPLILRPCDWYNTPFAKLQATPKNAKPVVEHENMDTAFLQVAQEIRRVAEKIRAQKTNN